MAKLMDEVRDALRVKGYALNTEQQYMNWIERYIRHFLPKHPRETGVEGVQKYLTFLAVEEGIAPSTQNQCLAALLFLYKTLDIELGKIDMVRAKKDKTIPTVLTVDETLRLLSHLDGVYKIMGEITYGGGLRLMECLRLRVKDIDLDNLSISLRETKSNRDRVTCLAETVVPRLKMHLEKVKAIHNEDLANGLGEVEMPYAYARKSPRAGLEWGWQYVFPAAGISRDPRSQRLGRHHIFETSYQRAIKAAVKAAGIVKSPIGVHTLRHSFATHLYQSGTDIRTIQELLGHQKLETTMIYVHLLGGAAVKSPLDRQFAPPVIRHVLAES
jgi:integron integrase